MALLADEDEEEALDREEQEDAPERGETDELDREEPEQPEEPELSNVQLSSADEEPEVPEWAKGLPVYEPPDEGDGRPAWARGLPEYKPTESSVEGTVARGAARSAGGGLGVLGGAYLGAALMPIQHPVAKLAGAAGGAIFGGLGGDVAWRAARDKFGYGDDPAQLEADAREHPWAKAVGETIPYLASMAYGKVDPIIRLVGAGIMGTIDLAQQLFHTGTVDPVELGIRSLPGAMGGFNRPAAALGESVAQAAGRAVGIDAATVSGRVGALAANRPTFEAGGADYHQSAEAAEAATEPPEQPFEPGRPDQSAGATAQENQVKADAEVPNTAPKAPGTAAAEPAPSKEDLPAATLETERSERRYPKDEPAGEDAESGVNEIEHADPAVEEALSQALGKKEPVAEPPPAAGELPPGEQETGIPDFLRRPKPGQRPPTEQTIQPETAAAPEPAQPAQGMTTKMKRDLADRGVSAEEAATLTPEEVQQRLAQPAAEPQLPKDVRNQLYKAGVPRDRVRTMAPEEAQRILSGEQTVEPAPATPKQQANALYQQAVEHVRNGGEATPEALQRELGVTPEQANKLVGRLQKAGLSAPPVRQGEESGGLSPSRNTEPEAQAEVKTPPAGEATSGGKLPPEKPQPQSLGAGAAPTADYSPQMPRAAVRATNTGVWKRINDAVDKLLSLPRWIFAPHTISDEGMQADRMVRAGIGGNVQLLDQTRKIMGAEDTYFAKLSTKDRLAAATEYENGAIDQASPAAHFMNQAHEAHVLLDKEMAKTGGATANYEKALPTFFAKDAQTNVSNAIQAFKDANNGRSPSLGELIKQGHPLADDLLLADGTPHPGKVNAQQIFLKAKAIKNAAVINDAINGRVSAPGMAPLDPLFHQMKSEGMEPIDPKLTNNVQYFAAPEVKAVFERHFNPLLRDGRIRNAFDAYMRVKSADTAWNLLGAVYHLRFMSLEAPINEISAGFARMLKNPVEGLKDIAKAPLASVNLLRNGMVDAIKNPQGVKDPYMRVANDLLREAGEIPYGMRGMEVTPDLETGFLNGLSKSWRPAFKEFYRDQIQAGLKVKNKFNAGDYGGAAKDTSIGTIKAIGEGLQLVMHPLFREYIPLLKGAANRQNMVRFLTDNPGLSHDEYVNMARKFVNQTDNAMGEMNQSTIYAPAFVKAIGNGAMVSPSWNIGDVKMFLGGARSFVRNPKGMFTGKDYDPRISYIPAFIAATALLNIGTQLLHTGKGPQSLDDVINPKTGGTTKKGNPESVLSPGYQKDVQEMAHIVGGPEPVGPSIGHMMYQKLAPLPRTALDMFLYNKNFANKDIANMNDPFQKRFAAYMQYFVKNALTPIMVQQYLHEEKNPGTKISKTEQLLGNRHQPDYMEDPKQYQSRIKQQYERGAKDAKRFHQKTGY